LGPVWRLERMKKLILEAGCSIICLRSEMLLAGLRTLGDYLTNFNLSGS